MATKTKKTKATSSDIPPVVPSVTEAGKSDDPAEARVCVHLGPAVVLNMRGQAVEPGNEDTKTGGAECSQYVGNINLSKKQRVGLQRLFVGLTASSHLVEMPSARGRKEVTDRSDALRWLLERLAEAG